MTLTLTLPELGVGKKGSTKDQIIEILSHEWPLSAKGIYAKIQKNPSECVSYQAIHKILSNLVEEAIICRVDGKYRLNLSWVKEIKNFASIVEDNYIKGTNLPLLEGIAEINASENTVVLDFNSLIELDKCWMDIEKNYILNLSDADSRDICWMGRHTWWVFAYPDEEYELNKAIKDVGATVYMLCKGNTPLDREAASFYRKMGVPFKYGVNCAENSDILVFGDNVMQVIHPPYIKEEIEKIYSNVKRSSKVDLPHFIRNILTKKIKLQIIINKNEDLAEQLRRNVLAHFKDN